eukprot:m.416255 g.416255  ORF g.416255 m.416255 type:complete len:80 (+) comp16830_c1_seq3:177-416(+)
MKISAESMKISAKSKRWYHIFIFSATLTVAFGGSLGRAISLFTVYLSARNAVLSRAPTVFPKTPRVHLESSHRQDSMTS